MIKAVIYVLSVFLLISCALPKKLDLVSETVPEFKAKEIFNHFPHKDIDSDFNNGLVVIETCKSLNIKNCDFMLEYDANGCGVSIDVTEICRELNCEYKYKMNNEIIQLCER